MSSDRLTWAKLDEIREAFIKAQQKCEIRNCRRYSSITIFNPENDTRIYVCGKHLDEGYAGLELLQ